MDRSLAKFLLTFLVCVGPMSRATPVLAIDPAGEALLVLQLHASGSPFPARLDVAGVQLVGRSSRVDLPLSTRNLDSEVLSASAIRWVETALSPDVYDTLVVSIQDAQVRLGPAWIHPSRASEGARLVLQRRVVAGEVLVLDLRWKADEGDPESSDWSPAFEVSEPRMPTLGQRLLVSEERGGFVSVFDRTTGRLCAGLLTGGRPRGMAWDIGRRRLYAAVGGRDEIVAVDVAAIDLVRRIPLQFGDDPSRVLLLRDGETLATLAKGGDEVVLISTGSLQESVRIPVGRRPVSMAADPRGELFYVSCELAGRIEVVDAVAGEVLRSLETSMPPGEIVAIDGGRSLVVAAQHGRRLERIDPATGAVLGRVDLCGSVTGLVAQPEVGRFYASVGACREVVVLRSSQMVESDRLSLPGRPGLLHLDPRGRGLLIVMPGADAVVDAPTHRRAQFGLISVGREPYAVVVP